MICALLGLKARIPRMDSFSMDVIELPLRLWCPARE